VTRQIARVAGLYAILGGAASLAGWVLDVPRLTDWHDNGISIQPNATLCVIFSGLAILALAANLHRIAAVCGGVVLTISGLTLLQWITGLSFGIDTALMFGHEWGRVGVVFPGRMGPPGSSCWTMIGIALVLSACPPRLSRWAPALAATAAAISALSLTGYLYSVDQLYSLPYVSVIALQTATFILTVSVGIIVSHPEREPMRTLLDPGGAGLLARRALPVVLIVPVILGLLKVKGQDAGLYDTGLGTAVLALVLIALMSGLMWWALKAVRARETSLRESRERLAAEAGALETLNAVSSRLWLNPELFAGLDEAIVACIGLMKADFGNIQLYDPARGVLTIAAQRGFGRDFLDYFREVSASDNSACGRSLRDDRRTVIEDVDADPEYAPMRDIARSAGYRAVQSTPLNSNGRPLGVITTHWRKPYRPTEDDLRRLDLYVLHIVGFIRRFQAEQALLDADRRKDEFLATLAHELRNPLAPVRNAVQLLHMKGPAIPELQWARDVIDRQMQQMTRLIDDLMDVSRISRGRIELKRERVCLATAVHGAVETTRPLIEQYQHELTVQLPPQPVYLDADLTRLAQVFANLLNNAVKYTDRRGAIRLTAECQGNEVVVTIKDSGIGIPRDKLHVVFELFAQVEGALERSQGGLGIGLSLVKRLVEMHGGSIEARSEGWGAGSEFVVRLPIAEGQRGAAEPGSEEPELSASGLRVLVVDDNRDAAHSLETMMQLMGNEACTAYDGESAVQAADEFRPDVILLDIGLPKLNGYEVCRRIRQQPWGERMTVIALTGWGQDDDKRRAKDAGFDHHLVKPVDPRRIIELLASLRARPAG
jgi:signal transduction histidine kinase/CheY-like chemotaxis protein